MSESRRPSNRHRPSVSRPGSTGLRFGMFAVCVSRDPDAGLNKGKAKPLYDLLVSFSGVSSRDTGQGYPYRETLATCLDCSKQTVDRAADYLANEIGLVKIHRRKVDGKPDENDANLYEIFDAWLIHGMTPPNGTPPQLVARYGHTIPGLDVEEWVSKHASCFDLAGWRATYDEKLRAQEAKREEQRRKERARRKKPKRGGDVMGDATPESTEEVGGSVTHDATGGVTDDASGGVMGDALSRAGLPESSSTDDAALSGRSPGGRRRPSTGSSEAEVEGGAAASGKDSSPGDETATNGADVAGGQGKTAATGKGPAKLTAEERQARDALLPLLPVDFRQAIGDVIPKNVAAAIVAALAAEQPRQRSVQQLVEYRVMPRWNRYWSLKFYAGELKKPFGPLVQMLADTAECGNLSCEDRRDFVIADVCRQCEGRKANKRADRAKERQEAAGDTNASSVDNLPTMPAQRPPLTVAVPYRECVELTCGRPIASTSDDTLCRQCRQNASKPIAPDEWTSADAEAYEEFAAEVDDDPSADELAAAAAAEEQRIKEGAELTARLRAQIAAEIGTPEQVEAYVTGAPF
jgi:hypothetical protein